MQGGGDSLRVTTDIERINEMETHIYTTPTSVVCIDEETGKAIWKLTTKQIAALREAGEKMKARLDYDNPLDRAAYDAWEAANK